MATVLLHQNNSGGSYWLSPEQFDALIADGWVPVESDWRLQFGGREAQDLTIDLPAVDAGAEDVAKVIFADVTGENPDAQGCNCCGQPFYFSVED